jgi:hypothetical protein
MILLSEPMMAKKVKATARNAMEMTPATVDLLQYIEEKKRVSAEELKRLPCLAHKPPYQITRCLSSLVTHDLIKWSAMIELTPFGKSELRKKLAHVTIVQEVASNPHGRSVEYLVVCLSGCISWLKKLNKERRARVVKSYIEELVKSAVLLWQDGKLLLEEKAGTAYAQAFKSV